METLVVSDGCQAFEEAVQLRVLRKTRIEKDNLLKPAVDGPLNLVQDAPERKRSQLPVLLVIVAVSAAVNTTPDGFQPEDSVHVGIEPSKEVRRGASVQRRRRREPPVESPSTMGPSQEKAGKLRQSRE